MTQDTSGLLVPRRKALLGAAALAAAPLAAPHIARAVEPIRIGLLLAKTGQIATQTDYLANGTFLAMHERGNTIAGRPAELVWLDEPTPQAAMQAMQELVQEDKVCAVLGGSLSSNALAEEATAARLQIPFVCNNAAATDITGKNCNRYTFRLNTPVVVQQRMLAPYALKSGKRWYHITASCAFGQDILRTSRALLKAAGGTEIGADEVPQNTADFSSFILKIREARPDVVVGGLPAEDLSTFLKQWNALGMKGRIPFMEIAIGDTDIWAIGPEAATGTFTTMWYYRNPANPPEEQAFAAAYTKKYRKPPADSAWMGWIAARSLFESIDAARSTGPMAIIEALEAWKVQAGPLTYGYRRFDHQMLARNLAVTVKAKLADRWDYFDVDATLPENITDLNKVFGTREEIGCELG
ncbi:ABC transporter substrate-binding protein [Rhodopila globiformis]|uniref:ABC transporter substrate-binding protein n=1 Tax=Rhodopila globiformis TaxID=1071 RepID=A0A2S6N1G9_RHOGL|nr:ABC transporter substrate-binding protein [Rhodopila globiformis]PPQ28436.1 ABC transporter substrate-binding protein [Rhodopila globiformis]